MVLFAKPDGGKLSTLLNYCEGISKAAQGAPCLVSQALGWAELKQFPILAVNCVPPEHGRGVVYYYLQSGEGQLVRWKNDAEGFEIFREEDFNGR